ncbi:MULTISPECIES: AAA family ATPase [unclassified Sphingopyxis]|uniref:AAA family ATPase n=1 Tax=unclassified Sphingopyxis TaxID=2614943 RepID=UPI002857681E|nr:MULTISPECIES: AAA family ATPase [unclassified Sphingopyxis]MDR7062491.1 MoxR-like ATPase [Sphingopyxis sp. BE235]MDR7182960.1 MoxR-like ATPase [Sphingopyxis sp. BE249]
MALPPKTEDGFYKWLKTFLRDRGLQFSKSGFKGGDNFGNHALDLATGYWENVTYSSSKPIRWIFTVDVTHQPAVAALPEDMTDAGIGSSNTAQADKAGLAVRILPMFRTGAGEFIRGDEFEAQVIYMFHGALPKGSSSDAFSFNPATGAMRRLNTPVDYIFAGLLGLRAASDAIELTVDGDERFITYAEVLDALQAAINIAPQGADAGPIPVYDLTDSGDLERIKTDLAKAWDDAGPPPAQAAAATGVTDHEDEDEEAEALDFSALEIPENPDLLGIDPAVYRQINAMLQSGKQHLMLYGPPGTGKTSLARWIGESLPGGNWTLITGSSDWSSQDIIGGYQPIGGGDVDFVPGILLRTFRQPLIIDELNRCDIDKVIGPLFTVLSGQQTTLPYRTDLNDKDSQQYVILPNPKPGAEDHEFAPGPGWRLIATINSIDKASLYQMSYALSRRFGWVYVDAPRDLRGFVRDYLLHVGVVQEAPAADAPCPLATLWASINSVRVIGPAPIIDAIKAIRILDPDATFFAAANAAMRSAVLDALDMVLLPMLDGIAHQDAMTIADETIAAFSLQDDQAAQVRARLETVAI